MWNWRIGALGLLGAVAVLLGAAGGLGQERAEAGKSQSIIVEKVTIPGGALQLFTFDPSWGPDFMLADGQSENPGFLPPGGYSVAETPVPAGWVLTSATCDNGDDPAAITLVPNTDVTCTFTNTQQGADYRRQGDESAGGGPGVRVRSQLRRQLLPHGHGRAERLRLPESWAAERQRDRAARLAADVGHVRRRDESGPGQHRARSRRDRDLHLHEHARTAAAPAPDGRPDHHHQDDHPGGFAAAVRVHAQLRRERVPHRRRDGRLQPAQSRALQRGRDRAGGLDADVGDLQRRESDRRDRSPGRRDRALHVRQREGAAAASSSSSATAGAGTEARTGTEAGAETRTRTRAGGRAEAGAEARTGARTGA